MQSNAAQPECLAEAQEILIHYGGVSYAIHELLGRHRVAQGQLPALSLPHLSGVQPMLAKMIEPVERLAI